jgi:hypothetical protein
MLRFAQHDSMRPACFTYLRNAALAGRTSDPAAARRCTCMASILLNAAFAAAILGGAWLLTHLFARAMYIVCPACRTLNARRRQHCRKCGELIRPPQHR